MSEGSYDVVFECVGKNSWRSGVQALCEFPGRDHLNWETGAPEAIAKIQDVGKVVSWIYELAIESETYLKGQFIALFLCHLSDDQLEQLVGEDEALERVVDYAWEYDLEPEDVAGSVRFA